MKTLIDTEVIEQAVEALEADCAGRCNAEYNPCAAKLSANNLRAALEAKEQPTDDKMKECLVGTPDKAQPPIECIQKPELESLRKDAARYRWLKEHKFRWNSHCWHSQFGTILRHEELDATIDAARAAEGG